MSQTRLRETLSAVFENQAQLLDLENHPDFDSFQSRHGLLIPKKDFLQVFVHKSFAHEFSTPHQEQLEFLGDAVVQLILTDELYRRMGHRTEGELSKRRSALVNQEGLATMARGLELGELIVVGKGEFKKNLFDQDVVLADTFEALMGQIYRFQGLEKTHSLLLAWLKDFIPLAFEDNFLESFDAKSQLQEKVLAKYKKLPVYRATEKGQQFEVSLWINEKLCASGVFGSKKSGEKALARDVLEKNHF
jgi:ribonuclease-3